jgi:predicted HicB family RNase H-like nuclease
MRAKGCLEYKGYLGSIEIDSEARLFHGRIEFIEDLVTFEGSSYLELEREFKAAVNDYLKTCKEAGREPDAPFKGTFNVRLGADLHKRAAIAAKRQGRSLNDLVKEAVEQRVESELGRNS